MKHTTKFLCMALSLIMLFAVNIPAMAEGTINKLDYTLDEKFDSETDGVLLVPLDTEKRYVTGNIDKKVSDSTYELGFKIKPEAPSGNFILQFCGSSTNYPTVDVKFAKVSSGTAYSFCINNGTVMTATQFAQGDWNDIRMVVNEDAANNQLTVATYLNGQYIDTVTISKNNIAKEDRDLYQVKYYRHAEFEGKISIDDMYIAKYTPVTDFNRTISVKVVKGQDAVLPATINDVAVTWGAINEETNTATGLLDGYAVDVKATATIQEIDMPYTAAIAENTLTITKETDYAPAAKIYGATYDGNKLTAVNEIGTIAADEAWNGSTKTVSMGSHTKAFIWDSALKPLAAAN